MTPYNLVNMAALCGLDMIALTDHNSTKNCSAAVTAGRAAGITVVPGAEITTQEDIHVVCLFPCVESASEFGEEIYRLLPDIKNCSDIFGDQLIYDAEDNVTAVEERLLINACSISIMRLPGLVQEYGGVCFPAHIDRDSYSAIAVLGAIPEECGFTAVEISAAGDKESIVSEYNLSDKKIITSSDAHYLENIAERERWLELEESSPDALIKFLSATK